MEKCFMIFIISISLVMVFAVRSGLDALNVDYKTFTQPVKINGDEVTMNKCVFNSNSAYSIMKMGRSISYSLTVDKQTVTLNDCVFTEKY